MVGNLPPLGVLLAFSLAAAIGYGILPIQALLLPFMLASVVARAMRFYMVAALLYWFGEPIRDFIEKRLTLVTTVFVVLLVGGFVAVRYVF